MKNFLCVYTGTPSKLEMWEMLSQAERQQRQADGMGAWEEWANLHKDKIVSQGGPLGKTKIVTSEGIADIRNNLSAFVIVRAPSQEHAAQMFTNHPHFSIFPGEGVEIMEISKIPS